MVHSLKILWVAFAAVLATSAVIASAAQAVPMFKAAKYPVTIHGTSAKGVGKFETEAGVVECKGSYHGELTTESSTIILHPTVTECAAFGFLSITVQTTDPNNSANRCDYLLHATEKVSEDSYKAHVDLACTNWAIKIFASTCKSEVKAQTGLTTVEITDNTAASPKDVLAKPNITAIETNKKGGIAYTVTEDGFGCPFGGTGAKVGGQYTASAATTITGQNPSNPAEKIGIEVTGL